MHLLCSSPLALWPPGSKQGGTYLAARYLRDLEHGLVYNRGSWRNCGINEQETRVWSHTRRQSLHCNHTDRGAAGIIEGDAFHKYVLMNQWDGSIWKIRQNEVETTRIISRYRRWLAITPTCPNQELYSRPTMTEWKIPYVDHIPLSDGKLRLSRKIFEIQSLHLRTL